MKKKFWIVMLCVVAMLAVAGCGGKTEQAKEKVLKIGTNATFVPFEFTGEKNELEGFDIELIKAISSELGMKPDFHNIAFDGLIPALGTGQIDVAISGMTITDARKEKIDFSMPYYESGLGVLVKKNLAIDKWNDLSGKKVAVQLGTTGAEKANEIEGANIRTFDHNSEALLELKKGGVDSVLADLPVLQYYLSTAGSDGLVLIPVETEKPEYFGIAIKKGNKEMKAAIDGALKKLKENGKLDALYNKYFHQDAPKMPAQA